MFEGGFLGLINIGVFDRSHHLGGDMQLEQADGTSWMGMLCPEHDGHGPGDRYEG